jgi:hypothetical protein
MIYRVNIVVKKSATLLPSNNLSNRNGMKADNVQSPTDAGAGSWRFLQSGSGFVRLSLL